MQELEESKEEKLKREREAREAEQRSEFEQIQEARKQLPMFPYRQEELCFVFCLFLLFEAELWGTSGHLTMVLLGHFFCMRHDVMLASIFEIFGFHTRACGLHAVAHTNKIAASKIDFAVESLKRSKG